MATRQQLEQQFIQDRAFWGSVGSRWRGLAGGVLLGGLVGATVGLAAAGLFSAVAGVAFAEMGKATLLSLVGFLSGAGMLIGGNLWGAAGQVSGAVAAGMIAQKELDPTKAKELQQEVALPEHAPEAQPTKRPPLFNWKVMALGALITGSIGAFLGYTGAMPAAGSYLLLGQQTGTALGAVGAGVSLGLFGTVFGIAFRPWQTVKEWTDGFFEGKLRGRSSPAPDQIKSALIATAPAPEQPLAAEKTQAIYVEKLLRERVHTHATETSCCPPGR